MTKHSKSHNRQNQTKPTSGLLHYYTISLDPQQYSKLEISFSGGMVGLNCCIWPCKQPDFKRVDGLFLCGFCYISATKKPVQPYNLMGGLQLWPIFILKHNPLHNFCPCLHSSCEHFFHSCNRSDFISYLTRNSTSSYKRWWWSETSNVQFRWLKVAEVLTLFLFTVNL